jgi:hypothetical protein
MSCVTALAPEPASPVGARPPGGFEVEFVTEDGAGRRVPLAEAQALPFERFLPVRRFAARKGQRHLARFSEGHGLANRAFSCSGSSAT